MFSAQRYRKVGFAVLCVLLALAAIAFVLPLWSAIAWGVALSILVSPINTRLRARVRDTLAASLTTAATILFIIGPVAGITFAAVAEVTQAKSEFEARRIQAGGTEQKDGLSVSSLVARADELMRPWAERAGIEDFDLKATVANGTKKFVENLPRIIWNGIWGTIQFVFALILMFFLLRDGYKLRDPALELIPLPRERGEAVLKSISDTVHAVFYGIVLVALIQGLVMAVGLLAVGVPGAWFWGLATVIACTIPFVGSPIVWVPTAVLLMSQGEWGKGIFIAAYGAAVVGTLDNLLRPVIIGARVKLHPVAVFFAIFGGIVLLGPVGILAGPVLLSVLLGAIQVLREILTSETAPPPAPGQDATSTAAGP